MSLTDDLTSQLTRMHGFASTSPKTVALSGPDQIVLEIDFVAVDSMSCSFREIRLNVPKLSGAGFDDLKKWAQALSQRITYLLEHIGPLEYDPSRGEVLIRSTPPSQQAGTPQFYEILLSSHSGGNFSLRRYVNPPGAAFRQQVDMQATHEVLHKLVNDLIDTLPSIP